MVFPHLSDHAAPAPVENTEKLYSTKQRVGNVGRDNLKSSLPDICGADKETEAREGLLGVEP